MEANVKAAVAKTGKFMQVIKIEDPVTIVEYGVMSTPGLVVNGELKSTGKLLSVEEILKIIS